MKMQNEELDKRAMSTKEMQLQQTKLNMLYSESNALGIVGNVIQSATNSIRLVANGLIAA